MTRLVLIAALLLPLSASATITLIQNPGASCGSSPCTITFTATGSNHLGILTVLNDDGAGGRYVSSISGAGTWSVPAGAQANGDSGAVSAAYCLSLTGGVTSITITFNVSAGYAVQFWEYSSTDTFLLDAVGTLVDNTGTATSWPGVALTLSGSNDVIVQGEVNFNSRSFTISSPYGNLTALSGFEQAADSENTASGTAPTWSPVGGSATKNLENAIAIKEGPPLPAGRRAAYISRY